MCDYLYKYIHMHTYICIHVVFKLKAFGQLYYEVLLRTCYYS